MMRIANAFDNFSIGTCVCLFLELYLFDVVSGSVIFCTSCIQQTVMSCMKFIRGRFLVGIGIPVVFVLYIRARSMNYICQENGLKQPFLTRQVINAGM